MCRGNLEDALQKLQSFIDRAALDVQPIESDPVKQKKLAKQCVHTIDICTYTLLVGCSMTHTASSWPKRLPPLVHAGRSRPMRTASKPKR